MRGCAVTLTLDVNTSLSRMKSDLRSSYSAKSRRLRSRYYNIVYSASSSENSLNASINFFALFSTILSGLPHVSEAQYSSNISLQSWIISRVRYSLELPLSRSNIRGRFKKSSISIGSHETGYFGLLASSCRNTRSYRPVIPIISFTIRTHSISSLSLLSSCFFSFFPPGSCSLPISVLRLNSFI